MLEAYTNFIWQRKMRTRLIQMAVYPVLALMAACSLSDSKDEASYYYAVPVGSSIRLNQALVIKGDQVAIYVQDGELMSYDEVDKYQPNCKFEIYTMSEQSRTVQPDTFEIIKVVDEIESSSIKEEVYLADASHAYVFGALDRSYVYNYATMMFLRSEKQKDVYRMTCQHWEDMLDDRYLTIAQMRKAMAEVFTLILNQGQ